MLKFKQFFFYFTLLCFKTANQHLLKNIQSNEKNIDRSKI